MTALAARLDEAPADKTPLHGAAWRTRSGIASRQITLR